MAVNKTCNVRLQGHVLWLKMAITALCQHLVGEKNASALSLALTLFFALKVIKGENTLPRNIISDKSLTVL